MTSDPRFLAKIVTLNGGELVGRIRLQKSVYFLESMGFGFGFDFQYYHYGPYSEELAIAMEDAIALDIISQERRVGARLQTYSVFKAVDLCPVQDDGRDSKRRQLLRLLASYDSISLELAATADFLEKAGFGSKSWEETALRKASKASAERLDSAKSLLLALRQLH
jgi:uncharacterized protein